MCLSALVMRRWRCQLWNVDLDRNGFRILNPGECIELLATARVGRVALTKNALPTIKPVLYELEGSTVTFHASGGLLSAAAERGDIVCFEVDFVDAGESRLWSVVVVGKLELESSVSAVAGDAVSKFGDDKVLLPMTMVSGRAS